MEDLLQQVADGSLRGWRKWYAISHAARCYRCGNFLSRLKVTLNTLKLGSEPANADALARLKAQVRDLDQPK